MPSAGSGVLPWPVTRLLLVLGRKLLVMGGGRPNEAAYVPRSIAALEVEFYQHMRRRSIGVQSLIRMPLDGSGGSTPEPALAPEAAAWPVLSPPLGLPWLAASSAYHGWTTVGTGALRAAASGMSARPYSTIDKESPCVTPSFDRMM
jgi:hypothetical protein